VGAAVAVAPPGMTRATAVRAVQALMVS